MKIVSFADITDLADLDMKVDPEIRKIQDQNEKLILNEINWWSKDESKDDVEYCLENLLLFDTFRKKSKLSNIIDMVTNKWVFDKDITDLCSRITDKFKYVEGQEEEDSESEKEDDEDDERNESDDYAEDVEESDDYAENTDEDDYYESE